MILVAGATGSLGGRVARRLLADGQQVRVMVRADGPAAELVAAGAEAVQGDLTDPGSLQAACAGVRAVVTTANSAGQPEPGALDAVDRRGNQHLVEAAAAADVRHFVFVSVLGADLSHPVPFLRAKAETEAVLRRSGMSWTVIRPEFFMDTWVPLLVGLPALAGEPIFLPGQSEHRRHSMVATQDVAAYAAASLAAPAAVDRVMEVGGPEALTWVDVVAEFERQLDRRLEVRLLAADEDVPGWPPLLSALLRYQDTYSSSLDMTDVAADLGVRPTSLSAFAAAFLDEQRGRVGAAAPSPRSTPG